MNHHDAPRRAVGSHVESTTSEAPLALSATDLHPATTANASFGRWTPALAELLPDSQARREQLTGALAAAGHNSPYAWHSFAALRYLLTMGSILVLGIGLLLVPADWELLFVVLLVSVPIVMWATPALFVRARAERRTDEIRRTMPDLLDLLNMCVSQGMLLSQAIRRTGEDLRNAAPALAEEMRIVASQAAVGTLQQALGGFRQRIDIPEVASFTAMLIQADQMGTSISTTLDEHSRTIRETLRQRADAAANKASFRMLFPTVLCLMPAVFLILLGPSVVELSDFLHAGDSPVLASPVETLQQLEQPRLAESVR